MLYLCDALFHFTTMDWNPQSALSCTPTDASVPAKNMQNLSSLLLKDGINDAWTATQT